MNGLRQPRQVVLDKQCTWWGLNPGPIDPESDLSLIDIVIPLSPDRTACEIRGGDSEYDNQITLTSKIHMTYGRQYEDCTPEN